MPYPEYLGWQAYFAARPVGWREDNRMMPLLAAQGVKAKPHEVFHSLIPIVNPLSVQTASERSEDGFIPVQNIEKTGIFSRLLGASGGDKIFKEDE